VDPGCRLRSGKHLLWLQGRLPSGRWTPGGSAIPSSRGSRIAHRQSSRCGRQRSGQLVLLHEGPSPAPPQTPSLNTDCNLEFVPYRSQTEWIVTAQARPPYPEQCGLGTCQERVESQPSLCPPLGVSCLPQSTATADLSEDCTLSSH
jgi:hypothetical protein